MKQPTIVCLCGSTKFSDAYQTANLTETLAGKIVLTIGCDIRSDAALFEHKPEQELREIKRQLDELHLRKIELADEVLILNVGGYVGDSTQREIQWARYKGKVIRYLEPDAPGFKIGERVRFVHDEEVRGEADNDDGDGVYEWVEVFPAGSEGEVIHIYFHDGKPDGYTLSLTKPGWIGAVEWDVEQDDVEAIPVMPVGSQNEI